MKRILFLLIISLPPVARAQQAEVVQFSYLSGLMDSQNDTTYVINFWATWCKPCVSEMPELLQFEKETVGDKIKLVLVSLDFADNADTRVNSFINQHGITSRVVVLDNLDYNSWIDRIHPDWGGAIPATLVVNKNRNIRNFHEGVLDVARLFRMAGLTSAPEKKINQ